ncbi:MAG: hypothetical protein JSW28_02470 [Thermoplasmata archaeon]|nr:MAG: hypothetical protein JSW28_02470 [Thermoplasmata archaeon]
MELRTEKGLKFLSWSLWANALAMALILVALAVIMLVGFSFFALPFIAFGGLLILIFIIFWLVGFGFMYNGKEEFGSAHTGRVSLALTWVVVAIVVYVANYLLGIFLMIAGLSAGGQEPGFDDFEAQMRMVFIVQSTVGLVAHLFISLAWIYLAFELASEHIKKMLWTYLGVSIAVYIFTATIIVLLNTTDVLDTSYIGGPGIIGTLMLIYCYSKTRDRVRTRKIKPVPPPMWPPPYFPPGYPPQPQPYSWPQHPPQPRQDYPQRYIKKPYREPPK